MKLSADDLRRLIENADYKRIGKKTIVCCLILKNGFESIGYSACIDCNDFDIQIGMTNAYKNAFEKLWELEGYHKHYS